MAPFVVGKRPSWQREARLVCSGMQEERSLVRRLEVMEVVTIPGCTSKVSTLDLAKLFVISSVSVSSYLFVPEYCAIVGTPPTVLTIELKLTIPNLLSCYCCLINAFLAYLDSNVMAFKFNLNSD